MTADQKFVARYVFVTSAVLCALAAAAWIMLLAYGSSLKGWGDGSGAYAATPVADFIGAVCPIVALVLVCAAFYPGLTVRSYTVRLAGAFVSYLVFLATLLPKHSAEAGMGFAFGLVVCLACRSALASLRRKNA